MNRLLDQQFVRGKQFVRDLTPGQNIGPRTNNLLTDCKLSICLFIKSFLNQTVDPCHHVQDTTVRESGQENAEKTSVLPREPSSGSLAPSPTMTSGGTEAGSTASHRVKETDRDRSAARRRREGSATHPIGRGGGQSSAEIRHERKRGNRPPDQSLAGFGNPTRCPGEALLWQS